LCFAIIEITHSVLAESRQKNLITEGAYQEKLLELRKKYLNKKLAVPGLSGVQTENINKALSQNEADTSDAKTKEREAAENRYHLTNIKEIRRRELEIIADFEARGVITHQQAIDAKRVIDQEYMDALTEKIKNVYNKIQSITSNLTSAISGFQEAETLSVERKYDEQIKLAGKNEKKVKQLEEKKQKEMNAIKAKYADKQFIVSVAQIITTTAVTAMESYKAMAGIPYVGPALGAAAAAAAILYGGAQIAIAKEQRDNAKKGYYSGGYTPEGKWNEPKGIVHAGEFVANRYAVQNPVIRKVFNLVDQAQKNNTVSSLTEKDFARALDYREAENRSVVSGFSSLFPSSGAAKEEEKQALNALFAFLNRNAEVTERLNNRLDRPFVGEVSVTGRRGIKENMDLYNRMVENTSRS